MKHEVRYIMLKEVQICESNNLHMPHRTHFSRQGVEFEDCGQQGRILVQEHSHIAGSCGERIPLSQVGESWRAGRQPSRSRRCTSWKPTEGPALSNRLRGRGRGRGLHAGRRDRSGTGESAPGPRTGGRWWCAGRTTWWKPVVRRGDAWSYLSL
ncbi:unnamed protein product [Musa hybrid cultivar]